MSARAEQAELTYASGSIEVLLEGTEEYAEAQEGMILEAGDAIKVAAGSSAELSFNEENSNLVRLSENTEAKVLFSGDEKLEMTTGEIFASISSLEPGTAFEIRTPTAVSGARGTDWITTVTEEGTDVEAMEDSAYVRHYEASGVLSREVTPVTPGQMTTVRKFQRPMPLKPVDPMRQQEWKQRKFDVQQHGTEAAVKRMYRPQFDRKEFIQQIKEKKGRQPGDPGRMREGGEIKERKGPQDGKEGQLFDSKQHIQGERALRSFEKDAHRQEPGFRQKTQEGEPLVSPEGKRRRPESQYLEGKKPSPLQEGGASSPRWPEEQKHMKPGQQQEKKPPQGSQGGPHGQGQPGGKPQQTQAGKKHSQPAHKNPPAQKRAPGPTGRR